MNKIINNIINEKKSLLNFKNTIFINKEQIKSGFFVRLDYEHLPLPLPKTRRVVLVKHQFLGLCISKRNKNLASTITLRNVIKKQPVESMFYVYSPLVETFNKIQEVKNKFSFRKSKVYFLNTKPLRYSKLRLDFEKN